MKTFKQMIQEGVHIPYTHDTKALDAFFWRLAPGEEVTIADDARLKKVPASRYKEAFDNHPNWRLAKSRQKGAHYEWVFSSRKFDEAIVMEVDIRKDMVYGVKKVASRKA